MWVEFLNALSMLAIYPVASYYASDDPVRVKFSHLNVDFTIKTREATFYGFLVQAAVVTLCWLPAVFSFAVDGRCEPLAGYGNALGLVVAVIIICKFLPQLHASLNAQGSHSLSYVTYGVDAAAGAVALAQKVFVTHERLSSWLPPVFLHALEIGRIQRIDSGLDLCERAESFVLVQAADLSDRTLSIAPGSRKRVALALDLSRLAHSL